jgi:hypothetical protein
MAIVPTTIFRRTQEHDIIASMKALEAHLGKKVFTNPYATIDQAAGLKLVESAVGKTIFNKWAILDPHVAQLQMEAAGI